MLAFGNRKGVQGKMKITICIGSSCHLKGSREIVEKLDQLRKQYGMENEVELSGAFCMGHCKDGVSVRIDDGEVLSVAANGAEEFFKEYVLRGR